MKTRLLIIFGIVFISSLIYANSTHALPFISPEYSYENAKHVVIGKVLSVEILSEPDVQKSDNIYAERFGFALYKIQVEDYLKNPLNNSTMKLLGKYTNQLQTRTYETYPYEINQRVLLYIQEIHNIPGYELIISAANSRVIPEEFSSEDVMPRFEYNKSPIKQIKSGVSIDEIQCKETLVLIQKYDGSPACVTEQTKQKLIERGWTTGKQEITNIENTFTPKYGTPEFDAEYQKTRQIYLDVRKPMNLPFIGLSIDSQEKNVVLGINSDKLTEEKDKTYYRQLVDELFQDVNLNIMIHYRNTTGLTFDE